MGTERPNEGIRGHLEWFVHSEVTRRRLLPGCTAAALMAATSAVLDADDPRSRGWGTPMATDLASEAEPPAPSAMPGILAASPGAAAGGAVVVVRFLPGRGEVTATTGEC